MLFSCYVSALLPVSELFSRTDLSSVVTPLSPSVKCFPFRVLGVPLLGCSLWRMFVFPLACVLFSSGSLYFSMCNAFSGSATSRVVSLMGTLLCPAVFLLLSTCSGVSFRSSGMRGSSGSAEARRPTVSTGSLWGLSVTRSEGITVPRGDIEAGVRVTVDVFHPNLPGGSLRTYRRLFLVIVSRFVTGVAFFLCVVQINCCCGASILFVDCLLWRFSGFSSVFFVRVSYELVYRGVFYVYCRHPHCYGSLLLSA